MESGKYRHRLTFEECAEVRDTFGEPDKVWSTYCVRWARGCQLSGRHLFTAQQYHADIGFKFRVRYDAVTKAITPKMRINWDGRLFNIHTVSDVRLRHRMIEIIAWEDL